MTQKDRLHSLLRIVLRITKGTHGSKHCPNFASFELFESKHVFRFIYEQSKSEQSQTFTQ